MVIITDQVISAEALIKEVSCPSSGAVAAFVGIAREYSRGKRVLKLEYEAYPEMALKKMEEIAAEVRSQFAIDKVAMAHRVGVLKIGEASIVIAISAPHRKEALAACQLAIERVKEIVPIWKKEHFGDGSHWVGWSS